MLTDIALRRHRVHNIPISNDQIDEPYERRKTRFEITAHGGGCGSALSEVPGKRDRGGSRGERRKDGENVVND